MAYVKANRQGQHGPSGVGTGPHLIAVQLAELAGGAINYMPYRGAAPAMIDLVAGQIDLMVDQVQNSLVQVRAGTIKALAIASPTRNAQVPDVPTVDEAGAPGLHMSLWYRLLGAGWHARGDHREAQRRRRRRWPIRRCASG